MADEEVEQTLQEQPPNRRIGLKVGLGLSGFAVFGQYSGMFIMAAAGRPQLDFALLGSILWTTLLFYFMYRIGDRKRSTGAWIGAGVGFLVYFVATFTTGYMRGQNAQQAEVDTVLSEFNRDLPKMIDDETRLESYEAEGDDVLVMNITVLGSPLDESEIAQWKADILEPGIQSACNNPETLDALNMGVTYVSRYRDESGQLVMSFQVDKSDCE